MACPEYLDQKLEQDLAKKNRDIEFALDTYRGKKVEKEIEVIDINDVLDYSVEDDIWAKVINGKLPYTELISKNAFLDFLITENEEYCNANNLCEVCRSPLEIKEEQEEVCGSIRTSEIIFVCPRGC